MSGTPAPRRRRSRRIDLLSLDGSELRHGLTVVAGPRDRPTGPGRSDRRCDGRPAAIR